MDKRTMSLSIMLISVLLAGALYLSLQQDRPRRAREPDGTNNQSPTIAAQPADIRRTSGPNDVNDQSTRITSEVDDIDINSGDLRHREYSSGQLVKTTISETPLSKEIRRLGLNIPPDRDWKLISRRQSDGVYSDGLYRFVPDTGNRLVRLLDQAYASDEIRRAMLTKFLTSLRTDNWRQAKQIGDLLVLEAKARAGRAGE